MRRIQLAISAALLVLVAQAQASLTIDYTVGGWGPQNFKLNPAFAGDTVQMQGYTGLGLVLPDNTPVTGKLNDFLFTVDYSDDGSYGSVANYSFTAARLMTITAPSASGQTISQAGTVNVTAGFDYASIANGSPIVFNFSGIGTVKVTPLGLTTGNIGDLGTTTYDVNGSFLFTPVPEPTTVVAGALLLVPFAASTIRILRKRTA